MGRLLFLATFVALTPRLSFAESDGPKVGILVTRGEGRRPSVKDVRRFSKALRKALGKAAGWSALPRAELAEAAGVDRKLRTWQCGPTPEAIEAGLAPPPDPYAPPAPTETSPGDLAPTSDEECAVATARALGLDRLVVAHVQYARRGYLLRLDHIDVGVGRAVNREEQRVRGKRFKSMIRFAPALARRLVLEFGGFTVACNVEGADVNVDGQFFGYTPLEQRWTEARRYRLKVTADGFFDWKGEVDVAPGKNTKVGVELAQPRMSDAPPPPMPTRVLTYGLLGLGAAALVGGVVLAATAEDEARLGGAALAVAGAGALVFAAAF